MEWLVHSSNSEREGMMMTAISINKESLSESMQEANSPVENTKKVIEITTIATDKAKAGYQTCGLNTKQV